MGRFAGIRFKSLRIEAPWVGFAPSPQVRERTNKPPSEGGLVLERARLRATTETSLPERRLARRQSPTIAAPEIEANQQGDEAADQGNEKSRFHGAIGVAIYATSTDYPIPSISANMTSSWNNCGPDTVHLTFKEGSGKSPIELAALLSEFQHQYDLPTSAVVRDRGVQGFASAAVDEAAGLRLDWTRSNEEGNNPGYFCLQIKGAWFEAADGETQADFLQLMEAYGPLRCTRIDFQQTHRTTNRLTPWWIERFESGRFRVVGKKHYEPRGKKDHLGSYPEGATLYHGSRSSERFARQYDKHLQSQHGPPRRRDEVELKGQSARDLWQHMHQELLTTEQLGTSRGATLHSFSKGTIRALLPIRDTSKWLGKPLPKRWSSMATEPTTWATLFDDDPISVKPRERKLTNLLKSYRYATSNFGSAMTVTFVKYFDEYRDLGDTEEEASDNAYARLLDELVLGSNEERAMEFIAELPPSKRERIRALWFELLRRAASNEERIRD